MLLSFLSTYSGHSDKATLSIVQESAKRSSGNGQYELTISSILIVDTYSCFLLFYSRPRIIYWYVQG